MKLYLVNADNIYFPQIKEYFREIISSYDNGNYRSAMVMLYSTIVCDLLLKLKELNDVYADTKAEKLLEEINSERKKAGNSAWEWKLIEEIRKRTELLTDESYAMIQHIYDLRNFSAHPAINDEYELISPTAEMTVAYIKKALEDIFTKPSVFAQSIVDRMSDDVAQKLNLFANDYTGFKKYLEKVYFQRMTDKMMTQVFRAFWKFAFIKTDGEEFQKYRKVNRKVLQAIISTRPELICDFIKNNQAYFFVAQENVCQVQVCVLLALYPKIYAQLDQPVKYQIENFNRSGVEIIKWFISGDLSQHIQMLKDSDCGLRVGPMEVLRIVCRKQGQLRLFCDLLINYFSKSNRYTITRDRYQEFIQPYLGDFSSEDFINLFEAINENAQIYGYANQIDFNDEILQYAAERLPADFDLGKYENFKYHIPEAEEESPHDDVDILSDNSANEELAVF